LYLVPLLLLLQLHCKKRVKKENLASLRLTNCMVFVFFSVFFFPKRYYYIILLLHLCFFYQIKIISRVSIYFIHELNILIYFFYLMKFVIFSNKSKKKDNFQPNQTRTHVRMQEHTLSLKNVLCRFELLQKENENQIKSLFLTFQHRRVLQHVSRDQQHGKSIPIHYHTMLLI